jgi:oligopeptide transport system permease protein
MAKYIAGKFSMMLLTLFIITSATFFLVNAIPGNPILARTIMMQPEMVQALLAKYGFDKPLTERYWITMTGLIKGDFGMSAIYSGDTVQSIIRAKLPVSARLGFQQMVLGVILGLVFGIISAVRNERWPDYLIIALSVLMVSVPQLVFALLLQKFGAGRGLLKLPIVGWGDFKSTVLPTLSGAFVYIAFYARLMKSSILDVIGQDYILTAESKGLSSRRVITHHVLRNAFLPILTNLPVTIATCIMGSFFIESVYSIPGLGYYYVNSISQRDLSMVLGLTVFFAALLLLVIFLTDILYKLTDPRIRIQSADAR